MQTTSNYVSAVLPAGIDLTKTGVNDIVVGREDGSLEVYDMDEQGGLQQVRVCRAVQARWCAMVRILALMHRSSANRITHLLADVPYQNRADVAALFCQERGVLLLALPSCSKHTAVACIKRKLFSCMPSVGRSTPPGSSSLP